MAETVIPIAAALAAFFLWLTIVPLLVRPFGIQLPSLLLRFAKRKAVLPGLTFAEHILITGILYFGCGMFIVTTLSSYVEWKYFHHSSAALTVGSLAGGFA